MRAFIAINLPDEVRAAIAHAAGPVRSASAIRWVEPESMHITLQFLGHVDDARVREIELALADATVAAQPFDMQLGSFGAFPSARRARVLWAGVAPDAPLMELQSAVEQALTPLGFEPEARDFHPHVTVGRAARGANPVAVAPVAAALLGREMAGSVRVASIELMESRLSRAGARYSVVRSFPL